MRAEHPDTVLAQRAAAGDAAAFAALYDRHERRAYNLCYRITGSAHDAADATQETFLKVLERLPDLRDRELNFGSYLLTAARHASYDALARRRRAGLSAEIPETVLPAVGPADETALLAAHQEQIRVANEQLPPRQREVLALREVGELSYDEVAEVMGLNRNAVAQLISRARLNLRDALRRGALGSIAAGSPDCEAALPLLALAQDHGLDDAARAERLATHLAGCATCRVRVEAMEEAGAAYRLWLPLVPALWLRTETAEAAAAQAASRDADASRHAASRGATTRVPSRRVVLVAAAGAALVVAAGLAAAEVVEAPVRAPRAAVVAAVTPAPTPVATPTPAARVVRHRHVEPKPKPKPKREPVARPVETPVIVPTPVPTVAPTPTPAPVTVKRRPKPDRHAVVTDVPEVVLPDPEPTPTPTPEPPPPPPPEVTPDPPPDPPPPRRPPPSCATCGITAPPPVP
jgi:RNA polymerase sigma factor (sigma-70 family)